jgi:drug/metabolite transporter (DMT)-like permease
MKAMTRTLSHGLTGLLTDWPVYAMVAAGVLGMFLTQSALNAGRVIAAQPGLTLSDPLISVLWGVIVFHEQVREGWYILAAAGSAAVIVAGVVMLARSPLLSDEDSEEASAGRDSGAEPGGRSRPAPSEQAAGTS